jgi:DNA-binding NarL/FixJ family response regulator
MTMGALRILIADDHAAVRRAIRALLESHEQWEVCGEANDGKEAVELAAKLRPDVVVLDITMPELNGLDAARRIRQNVPDARVLLLTVHDATTQLAKEARLAGGDAVVVKSEAHHSLIRAIESLRVPRALIHLAGSVLDRVRHVGAFFHSEEERYRVLGPFIAEGLANGEKALHLIEPPDRSRHMARLTAAGIDADRAQENGQIDLLSWEEAYLRGGRFDQHAMLTLLGELLSKGSEDGFPLTRAVAHMEWALEDRPGVEHLVEYEALVNDIVPNYGDVVVCAYDLTKFSGETIIDVLRVHPVVLIAGRLHTNAFYSPPDEIIGELRTRQHRRERTS